MSTEYTELDIYMIQCADHPVSFYAERGYDLDFSEASIYHLDEIIPKFHPDGAVLADSTYMTYAAYLGEVVRRNIGGTWQNTEDEGIFLEGENFKAYPLTWVRKKFEQHEDEPLHFKVVALKNILEMDTTLSTEAPARVVLEYAEGEAPAEAEGEAAADEANSRFELFVQAPAIVFQLVAGIDGQIDMAEIKKFAELLKNFENHPVPLFKMSVGMLLLTFKHNMEQVQEYSLIRCAAALAELKESLPPASPEDHQAYFRALYEFGEKIAKSSGGFLGIGGVSKQEKAALSLIKGILLGEK